MWQAQDGVNAKQPLVLQEHVKSGLNLSNSNPLSLVSIYLFLAVSNIIVFF